MKCYYNPEADAVGTCNKCNKGASKPYIQDVGGSLLCNDCIEIIKAEEKERLEHERILENERIENEKLIAEQRISKAKEMVDTLSYKNLLLTRGTGYRQSPVSLILNILFGWVPIVGGILHRRVIDKYSDVQRLTLSKGGTSMMMSFIIMLIPVMFLFVALEGIGLIIGFLIFYVLFCSLKFCEIWSHFCLFRFLRFLLIV